MRLKECVRGSKWVVVCRVVSGWRLQGCQDVVSARLPGAGLCRVVGAGWVGQLNL